MPMKNNAFVHPIYLTAQDNIAFPVIFQDIGMQILENVKAVTKMHILIQIKNHV